MPQPRHGRHAAEPDPPAMYGRASVPAVAPLRESTAEMPVLGPRRPAASAGPVPVSWQRASSASRRSLADGWGFTATGLLVLFCGWGLWAAAGRGIVAAPLLGLGIVLVVGAGVFGLSRLLGYALLERMLGRPRTHARWSHLLAGLFLSMAGVWYFGNTIWIVDAFGWLRGQI